MRFQTVILLAVASLGPLASNALATDQFFVSPTAAESGDGTREHPFATIEEARDSARGQGGGEVVLLAGTFALERTIEFDERDSGMTLRADEDGQVRLVGSLELTRPHLLEVHDKDVLARLATDEARSAIRLIQLPKSANLASPVHRGMGSPVIAVGSEVFLDGQALTRARWPNVDFASVGNVTDTGSIPRNRARDIAPEKRETGPLRGGSFEPADIPRERLQRWAEASDAWAFGYWFHDWADEQLPIANINAEAGEIRLALPHRYGLKSGTKFYVTNLLEELDTPGEYYLDTQTNRLYLWPLHAQKPVAKLVITTLEEPLLRIRGAANVTVSGLTLEGTRGSAIVIEEGKRVRIENCRISKTGANGIVLSGEKCVVTNCELHEIGATGVDVKGGDRQTLTAGANNVQTTRIHHFGRVYRTYQPAVRLTGVGHVVQLNEFAHAPHSAIIFTGNDHSIFGNDIFDVLRETGDCGAIYCGRDWTMHGTVINRNFIHHLGGEKGRWQNAIYLDDMASGIEVKDNVIWRCHLGMLIGGGRDLNIHDNRLLECDLGIRFDARGVGWMAQNIADPKTSTLHQNLARMPIDSPPWSTRFPTLRTYLTDRFGRPAGSRLTGNLHFKTAFSPVADPECVHVEDNSPIDSLPKWLKPRSFSTQERSFGENTAEHDPTRLPTEAALHVIAGS